MFFHLDFYAVVNHCKFSFVSFQSDGVLTVCLDGNFGLVRKNNAGSSDAAPESLHAGFFLESDKVDTFVQTYGHDKQSDKVVCTLINYKLKVLFIIIIILIIIIIMVKCSWLQMFAVCVVLLHFVVGQIGR